MAKPGTYLLSTSCKAPITQLALTIAHRVGRFLERRCLLRRDAEKSRLASDAVDDDPLNQLLGSSISYRIAVGPWAVAQGVRPKRLLLVRCKRCRRVTSHAMTGWEGGRLLAPCGRGGQGP